MKQCNIGEETTILYTYLYSIEEHLVINLAEESDNERRYSISTITFLLRRNLLHKRKIILLHSTKNPEVNKY
jgi:hypothetical protein